MVGRLSLVVVVAVSALGMAALGLLVSASVASADTTTEDFATQGCTVTAVPSGYNAVQIRATAAPGGSGNNGDPNAAGEGGYVTGTIVGVSGQLDVCVNVGGGGTPSANGAYEVGGAGGGASGVSLGSDFSTPVVIAGGGGGAGAYWDFPSSGIPSGSGTGGNAGSPDGGNGALSHPAEQTAQACSGGGGSQTQAGQMQGDGCSGPGGAGGAPSSSGPGVGGYPGANLDGSSGGAGYYGGGAAIWGGGGGGSDLCTNGQISTGILWGCSATVATATDGPPQVMLTFGYTPITPSVFVADSGNNQVVEYPADANYPTAPVIGSGPDASSGTLAGLALDAAGDVFVADNTNSKIDEIPAGGGTGTTFDSTLCCAVGLAVDSAGNVVFVGGYQVQEVPPSGNPQDGRLFGDDWFSPQGVAVDAAGNVFVADAGYDEVREMPGPAGPESPENVLDPGLSVDGEGLNDPTGVAVDTSDDVYVADTGNNRVLELTPSPSSTATDPSYTASVVASGLSSPEGVALDAEGDLLIANTGADDVVEVPAGGGSPSVFAVGLNQPSGLAVYAPAPTFTADTPPVYAPEGTPYNYAYEAGSSLNQEPAPTFAVASGSLPPGLTLDPTTGVLGGTPTATGTWTFAVEAENAAQGTIGPSTTISNATSTVGDVSPDAGPTAGGNTVTIYGTGFTTDSTVEIGSAAAIPMTLVSPTEITATVPAATASGTVPLTVTTDAGPSAGYDYTYGGPAVSGVSPDAGPTAGGNTVTITGTGFSSDSTVDFGSGTAFNVYVVSSTEITASAPAGAARPRVDVTVTTPAGTSATSSADWYTYGVPSVSKVDPDAGVVGGGNTVTINGTGFTSDSRVHFGSVVASVSVLSGTELKAVAPAGSVGRVDVRVGNPAGWSPSSSADWYTYDAP